ncbi:hypothetical protein HWV23_07630 [Natronomonas halophila]|uniref:hypothetical protein n=1 Tax=Natronomonas halophila TaxID=2747817 RepID=UPI0015B42DB7|nr:hypothetical protein [Natronomonas halophila]QLD85599.1 hypothetical protein HWV23_07630 [Natronomonas halophila]
MFAPAEPFAKAIRELLQTSLEDAVIYGDDGTTVLHEGPATIKPDGWVELPDGTLLSPGAIHHIDR